MNKEKMINTILNKTLENCAEDTSYNDNTLHDLILFGFKGLSNMTEEELKNELELLTSWEGA
jgi:hypothetical protein